ncbi:CDP-alcohol phosphatidyltransferase family protein [Micromonospora sp. CPCC 205556]|uniref:CDP-alcohol phosphatidyltransferase family protein n=1 Tax=Micromonospora sp. CPCC 205556 TaxID=3122398 RepID=UPI003FA5D9FF
MPTVRTGPVVGLLVQAVLLAVLAATVGLGPAGWLAGLGYGIVLCALLARGLSRSGARGLSPADRVTLGRAILVGGVTALVVESFDRAAPIALMVALTAVALALDGVDGYTARRTGTSSELGARFDMEVDSFLVLVLCVHVAPSAGGWVLAIGGMRYAFVAASWVLAWMRGSLPPRYWRKVVAATQGVLLTVAMADVLGGPLTIVVLVVALALLVESFGRDVGWLWTTRRARLAPAGPVIPAQPGTPHVPRNPGTTSHPRTHPGRLAGHGADSARGGIAAGSTGGQPPWHERPKVAAARH